MKQRRQAGISATAKKLAWIWDGGDCCVLSYSCALNPGCRQKSWRGEHWMLGDGNGEKGRNTKKKDYRRPESEKR